MKFERERGEQIRTDLKKRDRKVTRRMVDEAIQRGHERLMDGDLEGLAVIARDILVPRLNLSRWNIRDAAVTVRDSGQNLVWDHESVRRFIESPDTYIQAAKPGGDGGGSGSALYLRAAGMTDPRERRRQVIIKCFESLESLAVARGVISNSVTNWAVARGYSLQIGTWYQPARDDMPHEVQLVNPNDSEPVTVNMGKPGRGKGVAGHTETEDRYHAGRKIVDLVDFDECEGAVYDIPQSNPVLREVRGDMGLAADFTEHEDYTPPNVEILVPMTRNLKDEYIPFHGDGPTDTVVRPFTVPASSLSKRALKRFVASELTDVQKNIFESAYDRVELDHGPSWDLRDLIMECENFRGDHGNQGAVDRVQRAVNRIRQKGWIRSESDPNAIDWERILTNPDTITVFTASLMPESDEGAKYLFHSYLIYALRTELKALKKLPEHVRRERDWNHVPPLTVILRELHKVAPNAETAEDDDTIREVQEAMTSDFRDLTAMHRHESIEIIADTQNFIGEIKKRARVNFNRAVLFNVNFSPAKAMFMELAGEPRDEYARRVTKRFGVGEAAFLGRVGTGRSFEMTVAVAPPMSHHFDPDEWVNTRTKRTMDAEDLKARLDGRDPIQVNPDGWSAVNSGWDLRVYLKDEEYRPARELLDAASERGEDEDLTEITNEQRRPNHSVGRFAWDCLEIERKEKIPRLMFRWAFSAWAAFNGEVDLPPRSIGQKFYDVPLPDSSDEDATFRDAVEQVTPVMRGFPDGKYQTRCYGGIALKEESEWMNCCDNPELGILWAEELDEDAEGSREAETWRCQSCGVNGNEYEYGEDDAVSSSTSADEGADESEDGDTDITCGECGASGWDNSGERLTCGKCGWTPKKSRRDAISAAIGTSEDGEDQDADPARQDMDCCSSPRPVPTWKGKGTDAVQSGWVCENCFQKTKLN